MRSRPAKKSPRDFPVPAGRAFNMMSGPPPCQFQNDNWLCGSLVSFMSCVRWSRTRRAASRSVRRPLPYRCRSYCARESRGSLNPVCILHGRDNDSTNQNPPFLLCKSTRQTRCTAVLFPRLCASKQYDSLFDSLSGSGSRGSTW